MDTATFQKLLLIKKQNKVSTLGVSSLSSSVREFMTPGRQSLHTSAWLPLATGMTSSFFLFEIQRGEQLARCGEGPKGPKICLKKGGDVVETGKNRRQHVLML